MDLRSQARHKMNVNNVFNFHFQYVDDEFRSKRDFMRVFQNE